MLYTLVVAHSIEMAFFHRILFRRGKHPAEREATDRNRKYYHTTIYKMTTQNISFGNSYYIIGFDARICASRRFLAVCDSRHHITSKLIF